MKNRTFILSITGIVSGLALCPFDAGKAIEPPPDNATPPAGLLQKTGRNIERPALDFDDLENRFDREPRIAKAPFLGLSTAPVPDMVADHVGLEKGSGVIVRTVVPNSPAEKAGLSVNDIILKVGETSVGNPEGFSSTVRNSKIGDRIPLELIHKGKLAKVEVTLVERPRDLIAGAEQDPMLEGVPRAHADRLRELMLQNLGGFGGEVMPDQQFEETFRLMRERIGQAIGEAILPMDEIDQGGSGIHQNSTVRVMDDQGSIEIKSSNGITDVTVRDSSNQTLWSGPWNTEQDKAAAPEDIRKRVDKVNSGNRGFSFRFGNRRPAAPDTIDN